MSSQAQWHEVKEQIRAATDLVGLVSEIVALRPVRGGQEYIGLCPFHDDHDPSFRVYTDRQSFRCWACQAGGDCFQFVMLREKVPFPEALELLAERARIELPKFQRDYGSNGASHQIGKPLIYEVLAWAQEQFQWCLRQPQGRAAREYLLSRGLTEETIREFKLGYSPNSWTWLIERAGKRFSPVQLIAARMAGKNEERGSYYDFYRHRVMFPIHDQQGRTVAFGGRILPSDDNVQEAKYKNGQESPVFSKSRLLYGLDRARDAIVKQGMAIVVEGYMDCIAAQQSGVTNTVASLGTALTDQHVAILKRFAPRCVMVYDGDRAGQDAAEKSIPRFLPQEVDLKILTLTDDQDPADVCLKLGGDWFRQQAAEAPEVWEFKLRRVRGRHDVRSVDGAQKVLDEMLQALADVPALLGSAPAGSWQLRENILLARLSHWLSIPEQAVRERLAEFRKIKQTPRPERVTDNRPSQESQQDEWNKRVQRTMRKPTVDELLEAEVLQLVLIVPGVLPQIREQVSAEDWTNPFFRELWELCLQEDGAGQHAAFEQISNRVEQPHLQRLLVWLDAVGRDKGVSAELVNSTLDGLRRRRLTRERARLQDGAGLPADSTTKPHLDSRTLLQRAVELHRRRNNEPNG